MSNVVQEPAPRAPALDHHRLMLIGRPGLFNECLSRMFTDRGFETVLQPITDGISRLSFTPELAVFCIDRFDPELLVGTRQRISELQGLVPDLPIMMLFEEAGQAELRNIAQLRVTATVIGVPSIDVAVAAIQFALINGPEMTLEIRLGRRAPGDHSEIGKGAEFTSDEMSQQHDSRFTEREAAVLERLRQGQPNKIIAHALGVSESTVKVHLRNIMSKLKVSNRTQIVCILGNRPGGQAETHAAPLPARFPLRHFVPSRPASATSVA
jgi:DNA-binding NarL/FixJ family response regulator